MRKLEVKREISNLEQCILQINKENNNINNSHDNNNNSNNNNNDNTNNNNNDRNNNNIKEQDTLQAEELNIGRNIKNRKEELDEIYYKGRAKRIWYLSHMRAAKVQASLRIRAVSPEPPLLAHTSSELRGTFRQKARSLAPLNGWACAVKICHDGMLEDTNSLGGAHNKVTGILKRLKMTHVQGSENIKGSKKFRKTKSRKQTNK